MKRKNTWSDRAWMVMMDQWARCYGSHRRYPAKLVKLNLWLTSRYARVPWEHFYA